MRRWTILLLLLVVGVAAFFVLTRFRPSPGPGGDNVPPDGDRVSTVTLYFANDEYIRTGDGELERVLPEVQGIEPGNRPLAEAMVQALIDGPESESLGTALGRLRLLDVRVEEGTAFVNFSPDNLSGGSLEETLVVEQVVRTLTGLEQVQSVQFLVGGETKETLMGHIDVSKPITRDDL